MLALDTRWAFLGLSSIAKLFYRDLCLSRSDDDPVNHSLVAVSTTGTVQRAKQWLLEEGVPNVDEVRVYTEYEALLHHNGFDIVYISTPHGVHFEHARAAIMARRHVLLEKPATMTANQYARLADLAKEQGVVFMEAMWTRYFPLTEYLTRNLLPRIGPVRRILADYSLPLFGDPDLDPHSRFLDKSTGSGSLLDLGVYPLTWCDLALGPTAADVKVQYAETIEHETGVGEPIDDLTTLILSRRGPDPVTCVVTISSSLPGSPVLPIQERLLRAKNAPCIRIQGTRAEVALPFPPIRPESVSVQYYSADKLDSHGRESEESITRPVVGWGLGYQADFMARRVREQTVSGAHEGIVIGHKESLRVLTWVDQARSIAGISYDAALERIW
ncbi:hypothetical protein N7462_003050 [Penicillium macrosclerotiorum]|uniref:uncharacterized protein n=1 Tax=Penicillium macrosclerotiorum TaxID=303699 RepID=UPI002548E39E|nr:uncharacterized protein N7462_003050 [Penicillium macrosclerotiorum]KAJ5688658.1 hypothetical protein N7462_003050 [Penicillium macrosclerotiorum]